MIAETVSTDNKTVKKILHDELNMKKVCEVGPKKFEPCPGPKARPGCLNFCPNVQLLHSVKFRSRVGGDSKTKTTDFMNLRFLSWNFGDTFLKKYLVIQIFKKVLGMLKKILRVFLSSALHRHPLSLPHVSPPPPIPPFC